MQIFSTVLSRDASGLVKCWIPTKRLGVKCLMTIVGPLDHVVSVTVDDNNVFVVVELTLMCCNSHNSGAFCNPQGELIVLFLDLVSQPYCNNILCHFQRIVYRNQNGWWPIISTVSESVNARLVDAFL